jgi:hypothetical protein
VASQTILPGELLATVCTGDFDFVMYPFDMACEVVQVPEAFLALQTLVRVRPLFVVDADMVTEDVSIGAYFLGAASLHTSDRVCFCRSFCTFRWCMGTSEGPLDRDRQRQP